jgi:type IV pilus assembly protein PilN
MIRINLLPRGKPSGGRAALRLPGRGGKGTQPATPRAAPSARAPLDRWTAVATTLVLVATVTSGWLYSRVSGRSDDLRVQIEGARSDSARYSDLITQLAAIEAARDSLAVRVNLIQEIDGSRFVWPHILDEVARALPDYMWLTQLSQVTSGAEPRFRIEGRAGNTFAITRFLANLGDSPFLQGVSLLAVNQILERDPSGRSEPVQQFTIEAGFRNPPPELVDRVPLFPDGPADDS